MCEARARRRQSAMLSLVQLGLPLDQAGSPSPAVPAPDAVPEPRGLGPFYFVRHRRARRYLLRVDVDGRLRITIPRGGSQREAGAFAALHLNWVMRQRGRLADTVRPAATVDVPGMRARASAELTPRLLELAKAHDLVVAGVSIRSQRTRWGSCSRGGRISLNWRLLVMPEWVREYVLIHELMHLRQFDHSPAYWAHVAAACPGYEGARAWLRTNGASLR